jgi:multiple antibiotic resistance protein
MIGSASHFVIAFIAIFVALDTIGTIPLYISLTQDLGPTERNRIVRTSVVVAFLVALAFLFLGSSIFRYLGIGVADFKIAGGLVLLLVSLSDLLQGPEPTRPKSGSTGVVPLAVPLITGPGVITTVILQVPIAGYAITFIALLLNFALTWFLMRHSQRIAQLLGKDGTVVISKIAALLLTAIAVSMIRNGIEEIVRQFSHVATRELGAMIASL